MRKSINIYHLPGNGIYGGIKVGYQFSGLLDSLGATTVVATPDGLAPKWFTTTIPTISHKEAYKIVSNKTNVLFSYPPDYQEILNTGGNIIVHCQGTDDRMNMILSDDNLQILTCWPYALQYAQRFTAREIIEVGIHISDLFYYNGEIKTKNLVSCMPRRGSEIIDDCIRNNPHLNFLKIDNASELETAEIMKSSDFYIATSHKEMFGLPAFEAMAAGAIVLTVPVVGGMDYLKDRYNCIVAMPGELARALNFISSPNQEELRNELRHAGRITAAKFRKYLQQRQLSNLLGSKLSFLKQS